MLDFFPSPFALLFLILGGRFAEKLQSKGYSCFLITERLQREFIKFKTEGEAQPLCQQENHSVYRLSLLNFEIYSSFFLQNEISEWSIFRLWEKERAPVLLGGVFLLLLRGKFYPADLTFHSLASFPFCRLLADCHWSDWLEQCRMYFSQGNKTLTSPQLKFYCYGIQWIPRENHPWLYELGKLLHVGIYFWSYFAHYVLYYYTHGQQFSAILDVKWHLFRKGLSQIPINIYLKIVLTGPELISPNQMSHCLGKIIEW